MAGPATIETLAGHLGKRVAQSPDGPGFEIPCPAHGGDEPTGLHVWVSDDGRIAAACRTRECDYRAIMAALETATDIPNINPRDWPYKATYQRADGPVDVWRHDLPGGGKEFPTAGSRDAIPVKIWGNLDSCFHRNDDLEAQGLAQRLRKCRASSPVSSLSSCGVWRRDDLAT